MGVAPSLNYYQEIHVAKQRTDLAYYTSIQSAIDAITDNAAGKRYAVIVHPGIYDERVAMEDYIDLIAAGGREETVITHTILLAEGHDTSTLTGENSLVKGFTIVSNGDAGTYRARCVDAGVAGFEMEDCILTPQNTAAAAVCLNATASCDIRGCVVDSAGAAATGALFTTAAQTYNVSRTSFDAATDAIQITTTPTLNLEDCMVLDNLNQDGGTVNIRRCQMEAVALGTAVCTLNAELTRFTAAFATADAFAHTINCHKCAFSGQNFNNAATLATTISLRGCDGIATLTNAGVAGTLNLYECGVETLTPTAGTITAYGGRIGACGANTSTSFVWWRDSDTIKVIEGMRIAHALTAAVAGGIVIRLGQGTFAESNLTAVNDVDIVGEGAGVSLIQVADAGNPIIAVGNNVTCRFFNVTIENLGANNAINITPVANNSSVTVRDCYIASGANGVSLTTAGAGAPSFEAFGTEFNVTTTAIAVSGAVVADVDIHNSEFTCTNLATFTGANHTFDAWDSECGGGAVTVAANAPPINMTRCNDIGAITNLTNALTLEHCTTGAITNTTGTVTIEHCNTGALNSAGAATVTISSSTLGAVTQGAAAGTITITNSSMGDLSTGAGGTIRLNGGCYFTDIAANAGVLTWRIDPNHIKVVAGTANMTIADALALAAAGDTIEITSGTYAESNLTLVAGVNLVGMDPDQCAIVAADAANPILSAGVTCTVSNLTVGNTNAGAPAIGVTANSLTLRSCYIYGTGAGDAIAMTGGTLYAFDTRVGAGDVDLGTGACNLYMYRCQITSDPVDTSGALAHNLRFEQCDFNTRAVASAAIGATAMTMLGCSTVGTVTNAGTGAFDIRDSDISAVNATATGTVVVYGGFVNSITRAAASVVWWRDSTTLRVLPSGTTTDTVIQYAVNAAAGGETILIGPGTFTEAVVCDSAADVVTLRGMGQDKTIITQAAGVPLAITDCQTVCVEDLTLRVTAGGVNHDGCRVNAAAANAGVAMRGVAISVVGTGANTNYGIYLLRVAALASLDAFDVEVVVSNTAAGASTSIGINSSGQGTVTLRECRISVSDTNGQAHGLYIDQTTVNSYNCSYAANGAGAQALNLTSNATSILRCRGDSILGSIVKGAAGVMTYKSAPQQYEVWANMEIGDAITAAAAETLATTGCPAPAAATPYTVLLHSGVYTEVVTCSNYVNLVGEGRDSVVVTQADATVVTLVANVVIQNLTIRLTLPTAIRRPVVDSGVHTGITLRDVRFDVTDNGQIVSSVRIGNGATVRLENCLEEHTGTGTGGTVLVNNGICYIRNCHFTNAVPGAFIIYTDTTTTNLIDIEGSYLAGAATHLGSLSGIIRVRNSHYRSVSRATTGDIVDESPEAKSYAFHVVKTSFEVDVANANYATRTAVGGAVAEGGSGQVRLRINDNAVDAAGIENNADAAGALDSSFAAGRTPRYCRQVSANAFRATTTMFLGLRATPGAAVPAMAEDHFGFIWNGANFIASSSDGAGVGESTVLATPSTGAQHQLEAIQFRTKVEFFVDGVLVATHSTAAGIPTAGGSLDFQEYQISSGAGGATTSDVTLREGFIQECRA